MEDITKALVHGEGIREDRSGDGGADGRECGASDDL